VIDRRLFTHFDWLIFAVTIALALAGLASVYSATHSHLHSIYRKEVYWVIIGFFFLLIAIILNYSLLERLAYVLWGTSVFLLVAVFIIGRSTAGARRWIPLGFFTLQPSELAKLALVVMLAKYFSARTIPEKGMRFKDLVVPGLFMIIPFGLVAKQPDLGTAIILWMIFWSMVLIVKVNFSVLATILATFAAAAPFAWKALKGYQKTRLSSFLDPDADPLGTGYHLMQSKIAIGSGGFLGKGFTNGTQGKLMFLPEHHTDFIFAVFAEEWGLIGALVMLSLFMALILSGLGTAANSKDRFGFLLAFGITSMFFWHVTINLGMVSGILPVVGVPLPFISYGGSFFITSMIAAGLIINVKMRRFLLG